MKKEKLTIGMFTDAFFPMMDGVIMVVDNYARIMSKFANVIVFCPALKGKEFDDSTLPYKVVRCKSQKLPILDYSLPMPDLDREFMKEVEKYKLDIVHVHSPAPIGKLGVRYAHKHHIPVVGQMHSLILQDIQRAVKLYGIAKVLNKVPMNIYNSCDLCFAVSKETAETYVNIYKYKKEPIVINNATEMMPVKDVKKAHDVINRKHNIDDSYKVFLFVGRINALKNIYFIIDALKEFKSICNVPFKMIFIGTGQDEENLKKHIRDAKLEGDVILTGRIDDRRTLEEYYSRADVFLFPSMYDTSSLVQVEAACQSTPTIFIKGSVTSGTATNNVNAIISEPTPLEYAKNIEKLVTDKEFYEMISNNAKKDLYKTWEDVVDEVYDIYIKLIDNK